MSAENSTLYIIFTVFSSVITTLLAWILKKITSIEARIGVLEERMSWIIKLMNNKTEHHTN